MFPTEKKMLLILIARNSKTYLYRDNIIFLMCNTILCRYTNFNQIEPYIFKWNDFFNLKFEYFMGKYFPA